MLYPIPKRTSLTPVEWLPVLCNFESPDLRLSQASLKESDKIMSNQNLPAYHDFMAPSVQVLKFHVIFGLN